MLAAAFADFDDPNPAPGNQFGHTVLPLSTGNVVVTSPYDDYGGTDAGAVYLFNGATGALISILRGSSIDDRIGSAGVTALANGNFVVSSPYWDNGAATDVGAATWGSGTAGVTGAISTANSLVGSTAGDNVGYSVNAIDEIVGITALTNGNYVVSSPKWDNLAAVDGGAVTWGSGTTGIKGVISVSNSLVGSTANDYVGYGVTALTNGNYVVSSRSWGNGAAAAVGAATWGSGTAGVKGVISATNSLVGSTAGDYVGMGVTALTNGNYVVRSQNWDNGAAPVVGAATWGSGTAGVKGVVSASNSLVGSTAYDQVGAEVTALSNGNYVVNSSSWANGATPGVGAVTWGSGTAGIKGAISAANSLVGSAPYDSIGYFGVTALTNGNYVVSSPYWDNGAADNAGAATWGSGTAGIKGAISAANSLVGTTSNVQVGLGVTALTNGNYVVSSPGWNGVGAATWGSGTAGIKGVVSEGNSLVGSTTYDGVGGIVTALANGNYVVGSPYWANGAAVSAGAATWGSGTVGIKGVVSAANSLVGSTAYDQVADGVAALTNGNYVVSSTGWDNGVAVDAGAATWGSGTAGVKGVVSAANSLVGSTTEDFVGGGVTALTNGNYVVRSSFWNHGAAVNAGAATWGSGTTGIKGTINSQNSALGASANASLAPIVVDKKNSTFFARFFAEGGGTVRVGSQHNGFLPAPNITNFGGNLSYTENAAAILISTTAMVTDVDSSHFQNGKLTVGFKTGGGADNRLAIRTVGTGSGQINVQGNQVRLGTIVLGTFTGGSGTAPLIVTLTSAATPSRVQTLLRNITFRIWSENPATAQRTLQVTVGDGQYPSAPVTKKISVVAVNDQPVLGGISGSLGYTRDAAAITLAAFATVADADSANFSGGRLRVRISGGASTANRLAIGSGFTVDANNNVLRNGVIIGKRASNGFGTNELIVTFNTKATPFVVQQLVRAITFKTVGGAAGTRRIVFTVSDGDGGLSNEAVKTVNVT